jgi:D-alanyl-D-alanine carboxypeptidase
MESGPAEIISPWARWALKVLIVKSANDVAVMIAEAVAGSQAVFIARMNEAAQHLGMTRTHFANVNGLPDERQVTTARDLAKLARAIIVEFPEHADLFSSIQVQVGKKTMRTHNSLLVSFSGRRRHEDRFHLRIRL